MINGKLLDFSKNPTITKIFLSAEILSIRGYMYNSNKSPISQARSVLGALNISTSAETKSFTLASSTNNDEGLHDPHILDPDYGDLTPEPISAKDKFSEFTEEQALNAVDRFYEQDSQATEAQKQDFKLLVASKDASATYKLAVALSEQKMESKKFKSINKYLTKRIYKGEAHG